MKFPFFSSLLYLASCAFGTTSSRDVNQFVYSFNKGYPAAHQLRFQGVGLSYPKDKLLLLDLAYYYSKPTSIDEARIMMVELMEKLKQAINSDKSISSILSPSYFTESQLEISLRFVDSNGDHFKQEQGSLALANCVNGTIFYDYYKDQYTFATALKEPYAEAYEKVYGKKLE